MGPIPSNVLMCEPASQASHSASHASHNASHASHTASQGASHAIHRFNAKNNQIMDPLLRHFTIFGQENAQNMRR